jgi:hypothetical protein
VIKQIETFNDVSLVLLDNGMIEPLCTSGNRLADILREYYAYRDDFTALRKDCNGFYWAISSIQKPTYAFMAEAPSHESYPNGVLDRCNKILSDEQGRNRLRRSLNSKHIVNELLSNTQWITMKTYPVLPCNERPRKLFLASFSTINSPVAFTHKGNVYVWDDLIGKWCGKGYPQLKDFTVHVGTPLGITMDGYPWTYYPEDAMEIFPEYMRRPTSDS